MGKGEIARYEQFLLFPQCFQKGCFPGASKGVIVWEWVKGGSNDRMCLMAGSFAGKAENAGYKDLIQHVFNFLPHNQDLKLYKKPFENIVGKGENARNQHFFFPQSFLPFQKTNSNFSVMLFCPLQTLSIWTCQKFCRLVLLE